jgi:phosphoenolpyruvate carboxykinase (ATP)
VKGIAEGSIEWEADPDFGYKVAARVPGIDAEDLPVLQPRLLYAEQGRSEEYARWVTRLKSERSEFLSTYASLSRAIVDSVG